jgi:hypothetical protein
MRVPAPCSGKMPHLARSQVIRPSSLRTFQKNVAVGIRAGAHFPGGLSPEAPLANGPEALR